MRKKINLVFGFSLGSSIFLVLGLLGTILFAVSGFTALFIVSLVALVTCFYATPLLWIKYGSLRSLKNLLDIIETEHLYSVKELAIHTQTPEREIKNKILVIVRKQYLKGYYFDGEKLVLNQRESIQEAVSLFYCDACGASFDVKGLHGKCPYCNTPYKVSND